MGKYSMHPAFLMESNVQAYVTQLNIHYKLGDIWIEKKNTKGIKQSFCNCI